MKPRFVITFLLLLTAAFALLYWHALSERSVLESSRPGTIASSQDQIASNPILTHSVQAMRTNQVPAKPLAEQESTMRRIAARGNVPVAFYGQVVDQDTNPLADVKIAMNVRHGDYSSQGFMSTFPEKELTTSADGHFQWTDPGISGDILEITAVTKDGYELEPNSKRAYSAATGSPQNPVVFRMWQTNIHEQLIMGEKTFHIEPDGQPYFIKLIDGTISETEGGDLEVWIKYPGQDSSGSTNNWFCKIQMINGGLLEETNSFSAMFSAPSKGYTPIFQHTGWIRYNQFGSTGRRRFFIMLNNGQEYGRMTIELDAPYNSHIHGLVWLSYAINPSGSRILR